MVFMKDGHEYQEIKKEINTKDTIKKTSYGKFMLSPDALRTMADNLEKRAGKKGNEDIEVSLYRIDVVEGNKAYKTIGVVLTEEKVRGTKVKKLRKEAGKTVEGDMAQEETKKLDSGEVTEVKRLKDLRKRKLRRHKAKLYSDLQKQQAKKKVQQDG